MYTVKYKRKGQFFWKKIKNLKADGILEPETHRYFITEDEERIEIPLLDTIFMFDSKRFLDIKKNMEKEIGQTLPVNSKLI